MCFKREFLRVFPAFLFFWGAFCLINFTQGLMLHAKGISPYSYWAIFFAASVVAKVLVVIDHLPFIEPFGKKPLIYNIVWKTLLYAVASYIVRIIFRLTPFIYKTGNFQEGYHTFREVVHPTEFNAIQIWYTALFFTFVFSREFIKIIGLRRTYQILFQSKKY